MRGHAMHQWILFMTDDAEKNTQKCNIFCLLWTPVGGGATIFGTSDSFSNMALYKSVYLLTYLLLCLTFLKALVELKS